MEKDNLALKEWGERRSVVEIFKDCWVQAFNASFTLFVTLILFPVTGPFAWHKSPDIDNFLNGTFQVLDLLLRLLPTLGSWTRFSKRILLISVLVRPLVMIPLFIIPARIPGARFFGATWWLFVLMILFTISNGWLVSLGAMYCPDCVQHPTEKKIASEIFVIMLLSSVTLGVFLSRLPLL